MRTVEPSTVTNGRDTLSPYLGSAKRRSHAVAPSGSRQYCSDVNRLSLPDQAMYAVPEPSTSTDGRTPLSMRRRSAASAVEAESARAATSADRARSEDSRGGGSG